MIKASEFMRQGRDDAFKRAVITRPARLLSKRWIPPGFIECPVCTGVNGFAVAHAGKACEPGHPMLKPRRIELSFIAVDECVAPLQRSISESIAAQDAEDAAAKAPWKVGDYVGGACANCGRHRVCSCPNGMTRCEKCNWVKELSNYCPVSL